MSAPAAIFARVSCASCFASSDAALLGVEQDVRRAHLLGSRETAACRRVELARARLVTSVALASNSAAAAASTLSIIDLREQAVDLELHARARLPATRRASPRCACAASDFCTSMRTQQVVHAARVVGEAGAQVGRQLQQLGVVLGARDLGEAVGDQDDVSAAAVCADATPGPADAIAATTHSAAASEYNGWACSSDIGAAEARPRSGRKRGEDCSSPRSTAEANAITSTSDVILWLKLPP